MIRKITGKPWDTHRGPAAVPPFQIQVEMDRRLFSLADEQVFPDLRGHLGASLDQLERCQKALSDFLEEKRSAMPRFYFIGDEDLLEILGQASEEGLRDERRVNNNTENRDACGHIACMRLLFSRGNLYQ